MARPPGRWGLVHVGVVCLVDLHVWSIGPDLFAAELAVVSHEPAEPSVYKELLSDAGLAHVTIEVHRCPGDRCT